MMEILLQKKELIHIKMTLMFVLSASSLFSCIFHEEFLRQGVQRVNIEKQKIMANFFETQLCLCLRLVVKTPDNFYMKNYLQF